MNRPRKTDKRAEERGTSSPLGFLQARGEAGEGRDAETGNESSGGGLSSCWWLMVMKAKRNTLWARTRPVNLSLSGGPTSGSHENQSIS